MNPISIQKRDGGEEAWNIDKLIASIGKAFIPIKEAETVAQQVTAWATERAKQGKIVSSEIRDKVIEELAKIDPVASENYKVFKK